MKFRLEFIDSHNIQRSHTAKFKLMQVKHKNITTCMIMANLDIQWLLLNIKQSNNCFTAIILTFWFQTQELTYTMHQQPIKTKEKTGFYVILICH